MCDVPNVREEDGEEEPERRGKKEMAARSSRTPSSSALGPATVAPCRSHSRCNQSLDGHLADENALQPFNAFLAGFSACVGQFVLTASLRIQTNPANRKEFSESFSDERAFADFVFGSLILHFFCINFIN